MIGFGGRLKDERKRLKLSAEKFGAAVGVAGNTQYNYEKEERFPDIEYLARASALGVDTAYVVSGVRGAQILDGEQQRVLNAWCKMPKPARDWLLTAMELTTGKTSEAEYPKGTGLQALPNTSEVSVEKPWLPIPGRVMPAPKGDYETATSPDASAPRIRKVEHKDVNDKKTDRARK